MILRTSQQIFQLFSANLVKAIFGFIGSVLVLRGWSTGDIGDIYTLVGVLLILNQIGDLGSGPTYIKLANSDRKNEKELTEDYISYKLYIAIIYSLAAFYFYYYYYYVDRSREYFGLATVFLTSIAHVYSGFFSIYINSNRRYNELSLLKVMPPLVKTILIGIFYIFGFKHFAFLLFAFMVPSFVALLLGKIFTKLSVIKLSRFKSVFSPMGRQLYELSRWVFILAFFQTFFSQIDILMLKKMSSDFFVSQFVGAQKLAAIFLMLSQSIFTVLLPQMHKFRMKEELLNLNRNLLLFYLLFLMIMWPFTYLAPTVVSLILGAKYVAAIPILKVFMFQSVGHMFITSQTLMFFRLNKIPLLVLIAGLQLASNYYGNLMVIHEYKAFGVTCVSMVVSNITFLAMSLYIYITVKRSQDQVMVEHTNP